MRSIGIDFGENSLKIVELIQNKKSVSVHAMFEKKWAPNSTEHDKEIEAIEFVRSILAQNDFSQCRFSMSLRQDKVTIRTKTFPFSDRIKIQKSLSFEMEEDIPFNPDNCIFDYKVIQQEGAGVQVLAIAAPHVHIEKLLSLAKDFGIELYTITVEGIAFSNLIENWDQPPPVKKQSELEISLEAETPKTKHLNLIINLGHKKTLLTAYSEQRLIFARSLIWGADSIIQEIARKFQLPYSEAQKILNTQASLFIQKKDKSFEELNLASTIEKCFRDLIRDLQISLLELKSEHHGVIDQVLFTGGLSELPHLGAFLTQNLEVACNKFNPLEGYSQTEVIPSRMSHAVGIAIEAFKKPKNPALQFIRGEFVQKNNTFKVFWEEWGTLSQIGLSCLVLLFTWGYFREDFSTVLADRGDEVLVTHAKNVARLPKKQANEKGVTKYIKENKKRSQELKLVQQVSSMNSALDLLKKISENAPPLSQAKIDLVEFTVNDDRVKISGYADSPKEVSTLTQKLLSLSTDRKILEEPHQFPVKQNRVSFSVSFKMDRGLIQ